MKKVNSFPMSMKKNSTGSAVMSILQENQLRDKYVTNKIAKVLRKEGYCDIFYKKIESKRELWTLIWL